MSLFVCEGPHQKRDALPCFVMQSQSDRLIHTLAGINIDKK